MILVIDGRLMATSFNNNIRCIEILDLGLLFIYLVSFNNNIRCIEILFQKHSITRLFCLITT